MSRFFRVAIFALALIIPAPGFSQATEWRIDPDHTRFFFDVRHTYALVRGQFDNFSGSVNFDPGNPANSSFEFTIPVKSINTNISKRDGHLLSDEFFDAGKYPLITFKSSKVYSDGNIIMVEGLLTIKDVSNEIILPFTYFGEKENPLKPGEIVAGLETTLTINRLDYHVGAGKFYNLGVVGKDVDITFTMEIQRDK